MDVAYNQHADRARRKNRSSTNLNHLTLAPLTAKLPLNDDDLLPGSDSPTQPTTPTSYLHRKSAPTTPRLLSHSPAGGRSRSHQRTPSGSNIAKSKSVSHLAGVLPDQPSRKAVSGLTTPIRKHREELGYRHRNDSDWLLRTGAVMSSEAREFKGQAWLVSRQSSTSLTGMHDAEEEAFEHELARERDMASRHASRRGSSAFAEDDASPYGSRYPSRTHSRSHSLTRPRSNILTPRERLNDEGYFPNQDYLPGPDFVNLDEKLEGLEQDTTQADEAAIRRLVRRGQANANTWFGGMWALFAVEENDEDSDESESEESLSQLSRSRNLSSRNLAGISTLPEDRIPPPKADEGGWGDAAWLLSVATKVMF